MDSLRCATKLPSATRTEALQVRGQTLFGRRHQQRSSTGRHGCVITCSRSLNGKSRPSPALSSSNKPTTKVVPELSNLLPFLSAWGALMLSEGAGLPEGVVLLNLTWGAGASVAAGILLEKWKTESKPIQMRLDNTPKGVRRGGKLPLKDLVKAADGSVEGLKQLLRREWGLAEDTPVTVHGIDNDGGEFEFTPMVAHDLMGTLSGSQAVLLKVLPPQHSSINGVSNGHLMTASSH